jgi:hypothetical protein
MSGGGTCWTVRRLAGSRSSSSSRSSLAAGEIDGQGAVCRSTFAIRTAAGVESTGPLDQNILGAFSFPKSAHHLRHVAAAHHLRRTNTWSRAPNAGDTRHVDAGPIHGRGI